MRASQSVLARLERTFERWLKVEHGANVGPLLHVAFYYGFLASLAVPGAVVHPVARGVLWLLLYLTNYSLTVGVLHLHAHRPLFVSPALNRIVEVLLCFPSLVTETEMMVVHVHNHHKFENGPQDITSTVGRERGLAAVRYWLGYGVRVKAFTVSELFRRGARPAWRSRRLWFATDWIGCAAAGLAFHHLTGQGLELWFAPLLLTHFTVGYFAWLTHAPAGRADEGRHNTSMNTVNNWLGLFIFNQGYHSIHHRWPGIHWTEIPDKLELMEEVDARYVVPYWVTLNSAWRIVSPERFRDAAHGAGWMERYRRRKRSPRLSWFPYFAWL